MWEQSHLHGKLKLKINVTLNLLIYILNFKVKSLFSRDGDSTIILKLNNLRRFKTSFWPFSMLMKIGCKLINCDFWHLPLSALKKLQNNFISIKLLISARQKKYSSTFHFWSVGSVIKRDVKYIFLSQQWVCNFHPFYAPTLIFSSLINRFSLSMRVFSLNFYLSYQHADKIKPNSYKNQAHFCIHLVVTVSLIRECWKKGRKKSRK